MSAESTTLISVPTEEASPFNGKAVIVTGGLGFIGSHLARHLVHTGALVKILDSFDPLTGANWQNVADIRDAVDVTIGDIGDEGVVDGLLRGTDYVFNLAGLSSHTESMSEPRADQWSNATAQLVFLEKLRQCDPVPPTVFASTRQIYGRPKFLPVTEAHPLNAVDINGIHKIAAESYHSMYGGVHGMPIASLRLTNTYGPGMRIKDARQNFVGYWLGLAAQGGQIQVYGDGSQLRDLVYVDDVVRAFLLVASRINLTGQVYNLGATPVSLLQLAELMAGLAPGTTFGTSEFPAPRRAIDIGDYYGDYSSLEAETGWNPSVPLERGLRHTLESLRINLSHYS